MFTSKCYAIEEHFTAPVGDNNRPVDSLSNGTWYWTEIWKSWNREESLKPIHTDYWIHTI